VQEVSMWLVKEALKESSSSEKDKMIEKEWESERNR
jgi:hypothetical protein